MLFLFIFILSHFSLEFLENLSSISSSQSKYTKEKVIYTLGTLRTSCQLSTEEVICPKISYTPWMMRVAGTQGFGAEVRPPLSASPATSSPATFSVAAYQLRKL